MSCQPQAIKIGKHRRCDAMGGRSRPPSFVRGAGLSRWSLSACIAEIFSGQFARAGPVPLSGPHGGLRFAGVSLTKEPSRRQNMIKWNPADYARQSSHQQAWARELIVKLKLTGEESVLDVGCGDGKVTAELAAQLPAGQVVGIDSSPEMIAFATKKFAERTNLRFVLADASNLPAEKQFDKQFDVVFSNAALHWISDHRPVLAGIRRALKTGGRTLLQMGGKGNASQLITAIQPLMRREDWLPYFRDFDFRYGFHGPGEYRLWLSEANLRPLRMQLIPKLMLHESPAAFAGWLRTTWMPYIHPVPAALRQRWINEIVDRYLVGHPADAEGRVTVRMVRLEVEAEAV